MRHVSPFVAKIIEDIKEKISTTSDCTDEEARQIARDYIKIYGLSFFEKEAVKSALLNDIGLFGI